MLKVASSLRPHIVQVMAANQERVLSTEEIYELVADLGVPDFNPQAKPSGTATWSTGSSATWRVVPLKATASRRRS